MTWDLRCGRWQDTLAGVECDALIVDAPYSARTHGGHYAGTSAAGGANQKWLDRRGYDDKRAKRRPLMYAGWTPDDVRAFVESWAPRTRGWFVTITDHMLAREWESALSDAGRYVFAPLPFAEIGKQPRLTGDGPASWSCWIVVSRPKTRAFASWGSLPGAYCSTQKNQQGRIVGGKPTWLMRALIRDYTRPGDLVCDPCAGGGTTLLAAVQEGRRAVGSEMDPETHAKAVERLERKLAQSDLWAACERVKAAEQTDLL